MAPHDSNTSGRLAGRVALITGAAHGIGAAIATRYGAEGASVVIGDIDGPGAAAVAEQIVGAGGQAVGAKSDVTDVGDIDALIALALSTYGRIDILVNNAGDITLQTHFLRADEAWWDHFLDTNLKSQFRFCHRVAPLMVRAGGGAIINLSSGGATRAHRGMVAYDASKGGIEAFTRALAVELGPYNVRVNCLVPGLIDSRPAAVKSEYDKLRDATVPLGRGGLPEDLAGPAVFLASDDAAYVTGASLVVDGAVLVQQRSPQVDRFLQQYPAATEI
ncbi:MAG TPA: SDR family NAD(P)-dependent oxidoreductase [Ilumatobacteraceae bacterium]